MIDLYTWTTPNGEKPLIALEELGLPYQLHWVNIAKGEQLRPEYLAINPNNKIPAIIDSDGPEGPLAVFESGAILVYLAEKTGRYLPQSGAERWAALEWVFFQVGGTGPMFGQLAHFVKFAPDKIPYAIERYTKESERLLGVLERRLGEATWLAGKDYTIADMQNLTWVRATKNFGVDLAKWPHVAQWVHVIEQRPAVQKALALKPPQ
jgi:GSH-dependent disulfide-bond oxidoreductase